ncbi:APC family permease [Halegenticoccus tardaugens]|uniref:APC family permease n=1 Tax=Halegenticoccus tardaugens TaxID=2071624 RepID=UPI00100B5E33|nr:APC family permease [Halegenticoccus tardaugens]
MESEHGLKRVLSKRDVFVLAFGAMIGWGWIIQTGYWIDEAGALGSILAFVLGGVLVGTVGIIYGELASAMPYVGGEHAYSLRALGPVGSFVCTWAIVLGYVSVVAFEAVALPSALAYLVPGFDSLELWRVAGEPVYGTWVAVGLLASIAMTYMNYVGVRPAAQVQAVLTVVIALAGVTLVAGGAANGAPTGDASFADAGLAGVFTVALMTPFMFVGFDVIPQAAEEADMSSKYLAYLLLAAVACAALFYIAVIWAAGRALPGAALVESPLPAAAAMSALFGSVTVGRIMALAGVAGILTSWNAFIIGGSRAVFALAESGMLPSRLARLHPEHGTPTNAVLLVGGTAAFAPLFGEEMLVWVVNAGGLGIVVAWLFVVISFLVLRYREPEMERPLRIPGGYAVGAFGLLITLFFVTLYLPGGESALAWPYEWLIIGAWTVLGVVLFAISDGASAEVEPSVTPTDEG